MTGADADAASVARPAEVNLTNTFVVSAPQMDEGSTNWKWCGRRWRQFNQPDELYMTSSAPFAGRLPVCDRCTGWSTKSNQLINTRISLVSRMDFVTIRRRKYNMHFKR